MHKPVLRPLPTRRTTKTQNKRTQTSMPRVEFEPTIPVFERAKTVHALDCAATVIGSLVPFWINNNPIIVHDKLSDILLALSVGSDTENRFLIILSDFV
jgi:hypothetical protein